MSSKKYWTACQVMPGVEHKVRASIENGNRGAFLPTFAKTWVSAGKVSSRECPMVPGYVFFMTEADDWGEVDAIEGVQRVITFSVADRDLASRISDEEMLKLVLDHVTSAHDFVDRAIRSAAPKRERRRRPRPGKRIRKATDRKRAEIGSGTQIAHVPQPTALRAAQPPAG